MRPSCHQFLNETARAFCVVQIEDEVPLVFKRLRYPFQISKSALQAVGSPHTWPGLLAALAW